MPLQPSQDLGILVHCVLIGDQVEIQRRISRNVDAATARCVQDQITERHRVVFEHPRRRGDVVRNPDRTLFLGVYFPDYVNAPDPISSGRCC